MTRSYGTPGDIVVVATVLLLSFAAVAAGLFAGVGGRRRAVPKSVSREQQARSVVGACLVAIAGYTICYVAFWSVARIASMTDSVIVAAWIFIAIVIIFIFTLLAAYLARVTNEPRTLKAGAGSSIALFCGFMLYMTVANQGVGAVAGSYDSSYFAQMTAIFALLAFISVGPAIILAELAQLWMERAQSGESGGPGRQIMNADGEALG